MPELSDLINDQQALGETAPGTFGGLNITPLANPTGSGVATWPRFAASGATGAIAATRYVGGTTSGAPTTGAHVVGDFVIDRSGQVWICTVAGTPGTWTAPGSGRELAYAEITTSHTVTGVGAAARTDVTGLTCTFTPQSRPILIDMFIRYALVGDGTGQSTTIAAASNGVNTNTFAGAGTLTVDSTAGFHANGEIEVATGTTSAKIRYTALTATTFTGCYTLFGGGVMATGGAVTMSPTVGAQLGGMGLTICDSASAIVADSLAMFDSPVPTCNVMKGPQKRFAAGVLPAGVPVTYKIQAYCVFFGPSRIVAGAAAPAFMSVREL